MILQIYRDSLTPGQEANFRAIEEDAARICADLNCPHPHLAIESLSGPNEVWWLNVYESEAEKQRVYAAYEQNAALTAALSDITKRKEGVVGTPVDIFANYRAELSGGETWRVAGARFFVVTITQAPITLAGAVFQAPDGTCFVFRPALTREDADAIAMAAGGGTIIFAVRPFWGMPAANWIAAAPEFWSANPMVVRAADSHNAEGRATI